MTTVDRLRQAAAFRTDLGDGELLDDAADELEAERALADDLALVVHVSVKYGRPPEQAAEVLARYREARGV